MAPPQRVTIRSYQVGFGDCFLLGFHYRRSSRFVLIDFGSTGKAKGAPSNHLVKVAESIRDACGGRLHAVVATHRHADHVSGFATRADKKGSGDVIAALKPDVVVQPWTEDPDARPDARRPTRVSQPGRALIGMLDDLHAVAGAVHKEVQSWPARSRARSQLSFLGETNLANLSAVKNLMKMAGKQQRYVHFGAASGLRLPGVKVSVLGPPTVEQTDTILKQRSRDADEFWHLQALAGEFSVSTRALLFARRHVLKGSPPRSSRWLLERLKATRREQLREIVRILDKALNNTSVILLFEVGGHKLLFPGDAQLENWQFAMSKPAVMKRLEDVTVYKVGHHGSLNATPKTLWNNFKHRGPANTPDRLQTFVSTMPGKHGSTARETEVPRRTLVAALKRESDFHTSQTVKPKDLFREVTLTV